MKLDLEEGIGFRPRPVMPYKPHSAVLEISFAVIQATLAAHAAFRVRRLESCCFWYGREISPDRRRVSTVVLPQQRNHWGNYTVTSESMAAVSAATRSEGLKNLAQIHTHPGTSVDHSLYDDQWANSRRALSLVLPQYGLPGLQWPTDVGVHEFQSDYWYRLTDGQVSRRVAVLPDYGIVEFIDLRANK